MESYKRIVLGADGSCYFSNDGRDRVTLCDKSLIKLPAAVISLAAREALSDRLALHLNVPTNILHSPDGRTTSEIMFAAPPVIDPHLHPMPFTLPLADVNAAWSRINPESVPLTESRAIMNTSSAQIVQWILERIYGMPFVYEYTSDGITWNPPQPPRRNVGPVLRSNATATSAPKTARSPGLPVHRSSPPLSSNRGKK